MRTLHHIFEHFTKNKASDIPCQSFITDADEMEEPRSISFLEEDDDDDWDDDDDDD